MSIRPELPQEGVARLAKMRVAVTGHRGFIGSHLVEALRRLGSVVLPVEGDVRDNTVWPDGFDLLYHLAAAMPAKFADDPGIAFSMNMGGTLQALEACRSAGAHLVFTSTCGVYDPAVSGALSEGHPVDPRTAYAKSKLMGEMLCRAYAHHYGVPGTVFRLFNVYGAGQKSEFLVPYLIRCALEGYPATVYNPDSARDFVYIGDVVNALLRVVFNEDPYAIFNVGSGRLNTVRQIIDAIGGVIGRPLPWNTAEGRPDPQPVIFANIELVSDRLGWSPTTSMEEGLRKTVSATVSAG